MRQLLTRKIKKVSINKRTSQTAKVKKGLKYINSMILNKHSLAADLNSAIQRLVAEYDLEVVG